VKNLFRVIAWAPFLTVVACHAQTPQPSAVPSTANSAAQPLRPFSAQDGSASAQFPAGWKVDKQGQTVIDLSGPNGEQISLGNTYIARNAQYQNARVQGVDLNMPYQANLEQKFTMIFQYAAFLSGNRAPQIQFISAKAMQAPAPFGQCASFLGSITGYGTMPPSNFESVFCSLPVDIAGTYKNILKLAIVPTPQAAQERPTLEAILASYTIPASWLQRKLALNVSAPPQMAGRGGMNPSTLAQINAINAETANMMRGADISANCADQAIRETPMWRLPPACR
jgi:hypothetical protein